MISRSACRPWQPDRAANPVQQRRCYTTARDTIYFCRWTYDGTLDRLLPPYAPELNPVERIWLFLRERYLSHRLHADYNAIVDAACHAWRQLTPGRLKSLCAYPWIAQVIS